MVLLSLKFSPKIIKGGTYKNFNEQRFCRIAGQLLLQKEIYRSDDTYSTFTDIFQKILNKYASFKVKKKIKGNQAPFMNMELSKVIINKSTILDKTFVDFFTF